MTQPTITERGWPAHFILAERCVFRRHTLIEVGEQRVVVSTVGRCLERDDTSFMPIGYQRYFETMAFEAVWDDPYWEANTDKPVEFDGQWSINHLERSASQEANDMHDNAVAQIAARMAAREEA